MYKVHLKRNFYLIKAPMYLHFVQPVARANFWINLGIWINPKN